MDLFLPLFKYITTQKQYFGFQKLENYIGYILHVH